MERTDVGQNRLKTYNDNLTEIFRMANYNAVIHNNKNSIDKKELYRLIDNDKIDVVICDLTFDTNDLDGLGMIKQIKTDYPEMIVIGYSGSDHISINVVSNNSPSFDFFISKGCRQEKDRRNYADKFLDVFKSNIELEIILDESIAVNRELKKYVSSGEFRRLLKKITFTTHDSSGVTTAKKAYLYPMNGGFSSSKVFRMVCVTDNNESIINSVLKCSPIDNAKKEAENYLNYVKWYLPYTWRPEMLSYQYGKKNGMICYSFAYNDDKPFTSLTEQIENTNIEKVSLAVSKIFSDSTKKWYSLSNQDTKTQSIRDYYDELYFAKYSQNPQLEIGSHIEDHLSSLGFQSDKDSFNIGGIKYPKTKDLFLYNVTDETKTCICHGDLNTNNIMISDDNEFIFIDFQDTGIGHVFHDFIVFDICLRLYHKTDFDMIKLLEIENKLAKDVDYTGTSDQIVSMMQSIKRAAFANMPDENKITYNVGMAMRAFRLLKPHKNNIFEDWQVNALIACLLANLKCIKEYELSKDDDQQKNS
jgi:hypothetical protein